MTRRAWERGGAAAAALLADTLLGEPPTAVHPTVAMGRWLEAARRGRRPGAGRAETFVAGAAAVSGGALLAAVLARAAERGAARAPRPLRALALGVTLKPALSLRALLAAGREVEHALRRGDLGEARRLLGWHLVSRDSARLSAAEVAGAAVESLAENFNDGIVAPLLAFRAGGLAGAYAFRFVNTADAMLGYRTPELEWFGKFAARADDALGWAPARVSALLVALAAPAGGGSATRAVRGALADARRTASPNAGWPMAAMAGALGVRLTKRGVYALHDAGREPEARDVARARRIVAAGSVIAMAALAGSAR